MELSKYIISNEIEKIIEDAVPDLFLVSVKGGTFVMGGEEPCQHDNELPRHTVRINDFAISDTLITQKQWQFVMGNNPSFWQGEDLPVENVSYDDVLTFLDRLYKLTGKKYRLPTEAEWEFAARGGVKSLNYSYSGSDDPNEVAWYKENADMKTHLVRSKMPNELGIFDMNGNVWEWVNDWYERTYYADCPELNPQGPDSGEFKSLRGGRFGSPLNRCRIASRCFCEPGRHCNAHGFRVALSSDQFDNIILFSCSTGQHLMVNPKEYKHLQSGILPDSEDRINKMKQCGILVESQQKELEEYYKERNFRLDNLSNSVTILPTTDCNARCFYCFEKGINQKLSMSNETIEETIKFIDTHYTDKELNILWFGGEPLLNFHVIEEITKGLLERKFILSTHVVTNLSLLDENRLSFFRENYKGRISFEIPIDDVNENYNKVKKYIDRDSEKAFDNVIKNVKMLLDANIFVSISINYVASKFYEKREVYLALHEMLSQYSPDQYYLFFTPLYLPGKSELITEMNCPIDSHPYLQIVDLRLKTKKDKTKPFIINTLALRPKKPCEIDAEKAMLSINSNGDIYNCIRLVGRNGYQIGSVKHGITQLQTILEKQFAIHNPAKSCEDCNILPICQGGCVSKVILCGEGHQCHKIKQVQTQLIKLYYKELVNLTLDVDRL